MLVCSPSFSFCLRFFLCVNFKIFLSFDICFRDTHTCTREKEKDFFVVVVIWNLPLKQRCCCLFISKILFCYYVVGISLYFYNSFLFYFAYILLHSARHYDLNRLVKIQIICMLVVTFFNLLSSFFITHIVSVFLSKTHTHAPKNPSNRTRFN